MTGRTTVDGVELGRPEEGKACQPAGAPPSLPTLLPSSPGNKDDMKAGREATDKPGVDPPPPLYMRAIAACAALNSVDLGYDIGVSSGVGVYLTDPDGMALTRIQKSAFFGVLHFTAALGGLCSQAFADRWGRRPTFIVAQVVGITGIAFACLAQNFAMLMIGRIIIGLGVGIGMSIDPLYIAEAAPAAHRGKLTTWSELSINLGIMLGFIVNWALSGLPDGINWRVMVASGAVLPALLIVLALTVMPESPRWLVATGRTEEAAAVLKRTHAAGEDIPKIVEGIKENIQYDESIANVGWRAIFLSSDRSTRRAVLVGLGVAFAQQINGSESVVFFSPTIFKSAGVTSTNEGSLAATIPVGVVKASFVGIAACFLDSAGRRPLLILSTSAMAVCLFVMSASIWQGVPWLTVTGVLAYMASFSLGVGPMAWLFLAELFPSHVRAKAMSLGVLINRMTSGMVALTFLPLSDALGGEAPYFLLFGVITAGTALLVYLTVPETKRLSLEAIIKKQRSLGGIGANTGNS